MIRTNCIWTAPNPSSGSVRLAQGVRQSVSAEVELVGCGYPQVMRQVILEERIVCYKTATISLRPGALLYHVVGPRRGP